MPPPENNSQLLEIGKQCSHPACLLFDFLPFKCHHCGDSFCQEHFKVSVHKCPKYDENKHNRIAPDCPLCGTPVAVRLGQDPNERMEEHFNRECSVTTGQSGKTRTMPICARVNCKKALFSPIRCDKCKNQFCPTHRFPVDHNCSPRVVPVNPKPGVSNLFAGINTMDLNTKASTAGTATLSAIKKTVVSANIPTSSSKAAPVSETAQPISSTPSSHTNPFSKTDRLPSLPTSSTHNNSIATTINPTTTSNNTMSIVPPEIDYNSRARAERESRRKAMQARAKKGLLSDEEKATLASLEQDKDSKGDCMIM